MKEVTLCLPLTQHQPPAVLLGLKKRGFGQGKYVGFGGKIEAGETVEEATVRELEEETGLRTTIDALLPAGELIFLFPARPEWDHHVHVFVVRQWQGEAREAEEMRPEWFALDSIPYSQMWDDAAHWLPRVLAGKVVCDVFWYDDDNATVARVEYGGESRGDHTTAWIKPAIPASGPSAWPKTEVPATKTPAPAA